MGVGEDITDLRLRKVVEASTSSWMGFTVDFMMENGLQLQHDIVLSLHCQHYQYITKTFALNQATTCDLKASIRCRLFLKVVCLAEICTGSGDAITEDAWLGRRGDVINEYNWPEQPRPPEKDWTIWQRLLRVFVASETTQKIVVHLGPWDSKCLSWTWWVDPSEDPLYQHQGQRFFEYHRFPGQGGRRTRTFRGFQ
jgi:hypothetical protein